MCYSTGTPPKAQETYGTFTERHGIVRTVGPFLIGIGIRISDLWILLIRNPLLEIQMEETMIVVMRMGADAHEVGGVIQRIKELGYRPHVSSGSERVVVGIIGNDRPLDAENFISLSGVEKVVPILAPYKLASRDFKPTDTVIRVNDALIGGNNVTFIAGPCSVESREQTFEIARQLRDMGVKIMRAGAFKPRTSPYSFQAVS